MAKSIIAAMAFAAALQSSPAFPDASDDGLKQILVGAWGLDADHRNKIDDLAISHNIFVIEQFDSDGTGISTSYRGKVCGDIVRVIKFSWSVVDGALATKVDGKPYTDKIISATDTHLVMFSKEQQVTEQRVKTAPCPVS